MTKDDCDVNRSAQMSGGRSLPGRGCWTRRARAATVVRVLRRTHPALLVALGSLAVVAAVVLYALQARYAPPQEGFTTTSAVWVLACGSTLYGGAWVLAEGWRRRRGGTSDDGAPGDDTRP